MFLCLVLTFNEVFSVPSSFALKKLAELKRAGCFALIEHMLSCDYWGSVSNYRYCVLVCGM